MPAISRRRGSAASFGRAGAAGLPFCLGADFSTGSAHALFLSGRFAGRVLDRVTDVFLDRFELCEQAVSIGRIDALQRGRGEFGAEACELAQQRTCGLLQIEPVDAAVGLVAAALDPAIVA